MAISKSSVEQNINSSQIETLKTLFKVSSDKNALTNWQSEVITAIQNFLNQVKEQVITKHNLDLSSLMISYVPEADIEAAAQILQNYLSTLGVKVNLIPLTNANELESQIKQHDSLMVLCAPAYAQKVTEEPAIHKVIDDFGKSKKDALFSLLCKGGFPDTALKIVDGHYLIRSYHKALTDSSKALTENPLDSLQTFTDVILNVSGNQGLGVLPDLWV